MKLSLLSNNGDRSLASVKTQVGIILILSYVLLGLNGMILVALHWITELDLLIITSPFAPSAFVAKNFFDSITFGDLNESTYKLTESDLDFFKNGLKSELENILDYREVMVFVTKDYLRMKQDLCHELPLDQTKYYPSTILQQFEKRLFMIAKREQKGVTNIHNVHYLINKILTWIDSNKDYQSDKPISKTAYNLIIASVLCNPLIPFVTIWLQSTGLMDLPPEMLGATMAIAASTLSGLWSTTVSKLGEGTIS